MKSGLYKVYEFEPRSSLPRPPPLHELGILGGCQSLASPWQSCLHKPASTRFILTTHTGNLFLYLDWHPSHVETEGKETFLALEPLEANSKLTLGDGEGVPQVKLPIHVRVGEGHHVPALDHIHPGKDLMNLTFPLAFL